MSHYTIHPLASTMPELSPADYEALKQSLRTHGWQSGARIALWNHQVIDGRHRERACAELHAEGVTVKPLYMDVDLADDAAAALWVIDQHLGRRNLTGDQRDMLLARRATIKHGTNRFEKKVDGRILPSTALSNAEAARQAGRSDFQIKRAKEVDRADSKLGDAVIAGKVPVASALHMTKAPAVKAAIMPKVESGELKTPKEVKRAVLEAVKDTRTPEQKALKKRDAVDHDAALMQAITEAARLGARASATTKAKALKLITRALS